MKDKNLFQKLLEKKWPLAVIAAVVVIAIVAIIIIFSGKDSTKPAADKNPVASEEGTDKSDSTDSATDPEAVTKDAILSIEDAPEPTLNPTVADDVIQEYDSAPQVLEKTNQKTFNDCMAAEDYDGAKKVLDEYFATNDFSIAGDNTYDNFVYFYEKQGMYKESALYQIGFLEEEMGLDNIVEGNTKYQKLLETLKYVQVDDPRLTTMKESVERWKSVQKLLNENQIDTAISTIKEFIENGHSECAYAYDYLGKAYGLKPSYLKQARTYYIYLLKLENREANALDQSFKSIFYEHAYVLMYDYLTDEERELIIDTTTADSTP